MEEEKTIQKTIKINNGYLKKPFTTPYVQMYFCFTVQFNKIIHFEIYIIFKIENNNIIYKFGLYLKKNTSKSSDL